MSRFLAFRERQVRGEDPLDEDPLLSFAAESELPGKVAPQPKLSGPVYQRALVGLLFLAIFALGAVSTVYLRNGPLFPAEGVARSSGVAAFMSEPVGAEVLVDGMAKGTTPLELQLPVGPHSVEIRSGGASRTLTLTTAAGERTQQFIEFVAPPAPTRGRLEITSDPPGARVSVDGAPRGVTPLSLGDVEAGTHRVTVSSAGTTLERVVQVEGGAAASVAVSLASASHAAGWIAFSAPFEMQIFERGQLVGTTIADRLMVSTGRHELELVSAAFGFKRAVSVDVAAGRSTTVTVPVPTGSLSINALPWAEVMVDGRSVGTTPLANLAVSIGPHEIVWRHPGLGERRQTVAVTAQAPARIGVDFSK